MNDFVIQAKLWMVRDPDRPAGFFAMETIYPKAIADFTFHIKDVESIREIYKEDWEDKDQEEVKIFLKGSGFISIIYSFSKLKQFYIDYHATERN